MDFTTGTGRVLNDPREVRLQEAANNVSRKKLFARSGGVFGEIQVYRIYNVAFISNKS